MVEDRKTIVIKEIKYWKKHNMLPNAYCDFLLALYTEGEEIANPTKKQQIIPVLILISNLLLLTLTLLVIYFTQLEMILQISILLFLVTASYLIFHFSKQKSTLLSQFTLTVLLLIVFLVLVYLASLFGNYLVINFLIALNCLLWIGIGLYKKLIYITIPGFIGLLLLIIFVL
ncbi:hypothetical protein [Aquibacillus saliphilus]|uniref:hypothetical protein n=1 Tax=Aquibacillus saliphilus TaxID=1909422 RepID=UPI001CEFF0BC|nr:hypothetical protein [Aquibacillus saliphilus]